MASFFQTTKESLPLVNLQPQSGTTAPAGILGGGAITNVGTISHPTVTYGNSTALGARRTNFSGSTAAGSGAGFTQAGTFWYGTAAQDGFHVSLTFDIPSDIAVGASAFFGLMGTPAALAGDASALTNVIGVGYDSGDAVTANWSLYTNNSGTSTKTAIPNSGRATLLGHTLVLQFRSMGSTSVNVTLKDNTVLIGNTAGKILLDTDVGAGSGGPVNIPAAETLMGFAANIYNGSVAAAVQLQLQKYTVSTSA